MSDQDDIKEAERRIREAIETGADTLDLSGLKGFASLSELNADITTATSLTYLNLSETAINDLSTIRRLTAIRRLNLRKTQIADISDITGMSGIMTLDLDQTAISDLAPLAGMKNVTTVYLNETQVTDLSPIAGMTWIETLHFADTQIKDISPIVGMIGMTWLDISGSQVVDLRPLRSLKRLIEAPELDGLTLRECKACDLDSRIAEIAEIKDNSERARTLFDYLEDWVLPGETSSNTESKLPERKPAPLEVLVSETLVTRANSKGLPRNDANELAKLGWEALKEYRTDFAADFNPSNYAPLPRRLEAFDRAMGYEYDPKNVIRIGVQAQRLVRLAENTEFVQNLPTGAADDMRDFAAALLVYVERFPDWVTYNAEPAPTSTVSQDANTAAFVQVADVLETTDGVDKDVADEYRAEVDQVQLPDSGEVEVKAVSSSTRELSLGLAEHTEEQQRQIRKRNNELAKSGGDFLEGAVKGPVGVPIFLIKRLGQPLSELGDRGQAGLGWFSRWYRLTFGEKPNDDGPKDS
ncbi:hypothetical protein K3729_02915 [Rhodobacteraceae bacterium S2214]|nr:hypothetical protein K3729_02915 [Rhodobacteraceae bacterium S2214]